MRLCRLNTVQQVCARVEHTTVSFTEKNVPRVTPASQKQDDVVSTVQQHIYTTIYESMQEQTQILHVKEVRVLEVLF